LPLQIFFVLVSADSPIQDDDSCSLLSQKPFHFGDGNPRLTPDLNGGNFADQSPTVER